VRAVPQTRFLHANLRRLHPATTEPPGRLPVPQGAGAIMLSSMAAKAQSRPSPEC
jgi:hypothetical protein